MPKSNSPIAAASSKDMKKIRIFYLATDYSLRELCWDAAVSEKGFDVVDDARRKIWTLTTPPPASPNVASMGGKLTPLVMSPASDLAAFMVESPTLRVQLYAQDKNFAITEFTHILSQKMWTQSTSLMDSKGLGIGLEGTRISALGWEDGVPGYQGYFQAKDGQIVCSDYIQPVPGGDEDFPDKWAAKNLAPKPSSDSNVKGQPRVCGLASIRILLKDGKPLHRAYVVTPVGPNSMVYEYERDGKTGNWSKLSSVTGPVPAGTRLAAQGWNTATGPELYLYCQDGADGTKVTEWTKLGTAPWTLGPRFPKAI